ncbi:unnamed protein product [Rhizoctonia solani]|uniref:Heat shock 70 kDa protein 12A n=1 Tax=Rhizoctonia solani TaxID=456999 RepID=A0A8H2Y553_9AGAM|nr:unnamed protein product [Rhizoctonia solani]CAE6518093.1 unnamed protein product [Rhizoctonia solani]
MGDSRGAVESVSRPFRGPWEGEDKIVLGIDVGTTQSGVAFAFLQRGESQDIHRVTKWPGQEAAHQQGKVPSLVWYDTNKKAVAFGAEALSPDIEMQAEDNRWSLAKYFKLNLHPDDMRARHDLKLESLPPGVPLRQIYSDFLGYLLRNTKSYFEDRIVDGKRIWQRYSPTMEVVIAHPNGWSTREQQFLRLASVAAGLSTPGQASSKIRFVTEAEASVHFCIYHTNLGNRLQPGVNFAVCDAGGKSHFTLYKVVSARPVLKLEEKRASACVQAGAIFIDVAADRYLRNTLGSADLRGRTVDECCKDGVKDFEGFSKRAFSDETKEYHIKIADSRLNNPSIATRRGRMTLPGSTMKSFFSACTNEIVASVDDQIKNLTVPHILLVGGLGDSPYLRSEFRKRYEPRGCQITLTNDSTSKAVADGAVIWSSLSSVISRAPRSSFGITTITHYNSWQQEHQGRTPFIQADGHQWISGCWSSIVTKGVALDVNAICRRSFSRYYDTSTPNLSTFSVELKSYANEDSPAWSQSPQGLLLPGFRNVCSISADLNTLSGALERRTGNAGKVYWYLEFEVCMRFGGTELEAYLEWKEHGVTRTGPMSIVPEDAI